MHYCILVDNVADDSVNFFTRKYNFELKIEKLEKKSMYTSDAETFKARRTAEDKKEEDYREDRVEWSGHICARNALN